MGTGRATELQPLGYPLTPPLSLWLLFPGMVGTIVSWLFQEFKKKKIRVEINEIEKEKQQKITNLALWKDKLTNLPTLTKGKQSPVAPVSNERGFLVARGVRTPLPVQGTQVRPLVLEGSTRHGVAEPRAATTEAHAPEPAPHSESSRTRRGAPPSPARGGPQHSHGDPAAKRSVRPLSVKQ